MAQTPSRPWQSRQEMLTDLALQSAALPVEEIRQIRPVVPQQLMPQYRGIFKNEVGILDVLNTDRFVPTYRSWVSGAPVMFRNGFVDQGWSGAPRYSMQALGS